MNVPAGGNIKALDCVSHRSRWLALVLASLLIASCGQAPAYRESDFVGKWRSSRLVTPLHLHITGVWEIKTEEGSVLQSGQWRLDKKKIVWTVTIDGRVQEDINPVVSYLPNEFKLKERDGNISTFQRLTQ